MPMTDYTSWGRILHTEQQICPPRWRTDPLPACAANSLLPYGRGRSYGDCCLNDGGGLLPTSALDHFITFDEQAGLLRCEAGLTLGDILELIVPRGWFLPVTPGTRHATVGGAIANDVHGKNHHADGTFGRHVTRLELLRSDGQRIVCGPDENPEWFAATVGGLGLTGLITWAEFRLKPIASRAIEQQQIRFASLSEYRDIAAESDAEWTYTVAWVDCLSKGRELGRGVLFRGRHAQGGELTGRPERSRLAVPFELPVSLVNGASIRLFNRLYYATHPTRVQSREVDYGPFFYPLDNIAHWNRLYGRRGLYQFQCAIPEAEFDAMHELFERIAQSGQGSMLAVLKRFGDIPSPGLLSFPRPGLTLALDFANRGERTRRLLGELEDVVAQAGGALYPAKDALMRPETFQQAYPRWRELAERRDPAFSSSLWRRVTGETA